MEKPSNPENDPDPSEKLPEGRPAHSLSSQELPLFPLNLVLFPHMSIPLHIFEERYKEMINLCVEESLPFGIVLATGINPGTGETKTHKIGCTARISHVERMPDGKMNIEVVGEHRFRILDTHETRSYRTGLTEPLVDDPLTEELADIADLADEVQKLLRDFLTRSLARMGQPVAEFRLPEEPGPLSFMASCVLPIENEEKQALLEETDTEERLTVVKEALLREVTRLRRSAETTSETALETVEWHPVKLERFADLLSLN